MKRTVLYPGIAATSAMTLFSYLISALRDENFREPRVLSVLVKRLLSDDFSHTLKKGAIPAGWAIHYSVGFLFTAIYDRLWRYPSSKPTITRGALLGFVSGICGVIGWYITLQLHPCPPEKNLKNYFRHLIVAHIVFGIFALLAYRSIKSSRRLNITV